MHIKYVVTELN